jgi:hypothetical protein
MLRRIASSMPQNTIDDPEHMHQLECLIARLEHQAEESKRLCAEARMLVDETGGRLADGLLHADEPDRPTTEHE